METPVYVPNMDDDFKEMRQMLRLLEKEWTGVAAQLVQVGETLTSKEYWDRVVWQFGQAMAMLSSEYWARVAQDPVRDRTVAGWLFKQAAPYIAASLRDVEQDTKR